MFLKLYTKKEKMLKLLNNLDDLKVSSNKELMNIIDNIEKMGL